MAPDVGLAVVAVTGGWFEIFILLMRVVGGDGRGYRVWVGIENGVVGFSIFPQIVFKKAINWVTRHVFSSAGTVPKAITAHRNKKSHLKN